MSAAIQELAEEIKDKGRRSTSELPPLLRKAQEIAEDKNQDLLTRALAHRAAGNALQLLNTFEPALSHYDHAAAILEELGDTAELGRTLMVKVGFLFYLSRFDELFNCADRARTLLESAGDRQRLGRLDINLAHAYFRLDRHHESLACAERALRVLKVVGDKEGILGATINSGVTLCAMHEFERAETRFQSALALAGELKIPAAQRLSRYNLAYLSYRHGNPGEALRALALLRTEYQDANEERQLCLCWLDEAEILLEIGDLEESIQAARKARALAEKLGLNSETGSSLLFEAAAGLRLGRNEEALALLEKATSKFAQDGNGVLSAVSRLQTALFRNALGEAEAARSILAESGLPHRVALAEIIVGRIRRAAGDRSGAIDSFRAGLQAAEAGRAQWMQFHACYELGLSLFEEHGPESTELFRKAEGLLDSMWNKLGSDDLKMAFLGDRENVYTYLVRTAIPESADRAFELSEKSRSRVLRESLLQDRPANSADEIRKRLSADETVVEYFITGDDLCIFAVDSDEVQCISRPGVVEKIRSEWEHLERHFSSCSVKWERLQTARRHLESTAASHLQHLYDELIAPVRSTLRRSLVVVPHGFLHSIPFHALNDGGRYLSECHEISYSPSASLYCATPAPEYFEGPLFLAFTGENAVTSIAEVEDAAAQFAGPEVLINPSLRELRNAFDVPRRLIHIAGHAGIDMVRGKFSWIDTPDGRLTSRDLADMQLRAGTLVITGCQTARRMIQPGDEWLGLMRSLYMSGASAIVAALWDIRDESARRFSRAFYETFDGANAASAVQAASASVREWQTHPYFWSGFGAFIRQTS